jgi:hypothetical protein
LAREYSDAQMLREQRTPNLTLKVNVLSKVNAWHPHNINWYIPRNMCAVLPRLRPQSRNPGPVDDKILLFFRKRNNVSLLVRNI